MSLFFLQLPAEHGNLQLFGDLGSDKHSFSLHYAVANNVFSLVHGKVIPVIAYFCAT